MKYVLYFLFGVFVIGSAFALTFGLVWSLGFVCAAVIRVTGDGSKLDSLEDLVLLGFVCFSVVAIGSAFIKLSYDLGKSILGDWNP